MSDDGKSETTECLDDSSVANDVQNKTETASSELVTLEEAFARCGGFGWFQIFSIVFNTCANGGAAFILYAFAFLEKEP
jgi:hypothetical protein